MQIITPEQFTTLFPRAKTPGLWADALNDYLPKFDITTPRRVAAFLAQVGHESADFTRLLENLNYSSEGLAATWPARYAIDPYASKKEPNQLAKRLHRQPEAIANNVYANRLGNGPEESGDGWRFRGHALIQLTGRELHSKFAEHVGIELEFIGGYLLSVEGAVRAACWYWDSKKCNLLADFDLMALTRTINGGLIGQNDRQQRFARASEILGVA